MKRKKAETCTLASVFQFGVGDFGFGIGTLQRLIRNPHSAIRNLDLPLLTCGFLPLMFRFYLNLKSVLILIILALTFCFQTFGRENAICPKCLKNNPRKLVKVKLTIEDYKIDEYGKITWQDEQIRLQHSLLVELAQHPNSKAYLIFSYKRNSELKKITRFLKTVFNW